MFKLIEDSDEEAESERDDDLINYEPSTGYKCKFQQTCINDKISFLMSAYWRKKKQTPAKDSKSVEANSGKYGKLWQFIRDLLKNEKYNPRVIR